MHCLLHFTRAKKAGDRHAFSFGRQEYQLHGQGREVATARLHWDDELIEELEELRLPTVGDALVKRVGNRLRKPCGA